jgi:hypothetical protein
MAQLFRQLAGVPETNDYEQRLLAIPFTGSTLGEVLPRLRKPDSSFYEKSYLEGLAVARTLVKLRIDDDVTDIKICDSPDVIVYHRDGRVTYVEHTISGDPDEVSFPHHLEEASIALRKLADTDEVLAAALAAGYFETRVADPGIAARARPAQLAAAVAALRPTWQTGAQALRAVSSALTTYNAQIS